MSAGITKCAAVRYWRVWTFLPIDVLTARVAHIYQHLTGKRIQEWNPAAVASQQTGGLGSCRPSYVRELVF